MPQASSSEEWEVLAQRLVADLAQELHAEVESQHLNDALLEFRLRLPRARTAAVKVIFSPFEVIVAGDAREQLELGPLPDSATRVTDLIRSMAAER